MASRSLGSNQVRLVGMMPPTLAMAIEFLMGGQLILQMTWNFWFASGAMPDAGNGDHTIFRQNPVNNPVRRQNYFTDVFILRFRHNPSDVRELFQYIHFGHEPKPKRFGDRMIFCGDEGHNIAQ